MAVQRRKTEQQSNLNLEAVGAKLDLISGDT
jgi:hypothetical protein